MLARTFLFLPGIGPVRETRLWKRGIHSWADYRSLPRVNGVRPRVKAQHDQLLSLAEGAVGKNPAFFAHVLPAIEQWRAYHPFREGAAYLDIETRGERDNNDVTVVGVRFRGKSHLFVRAERPDGSSAASAIAASGADVYTPEAVSDLLRDATALVTFNGQSFDLPVLAADGVAIPKVPSVDLRVVFHRAGIEGGLKRIEETLGLTRDPTVRGLSGYDAVKLWRRFEKDEDQEALQTLLAYNAADFENLEPLAEIACARLQEKLLADVTQQSRLPLIHAQASTADP